MSCNYPQYGTYSNENWEKHYELDDDTFAGQFKNGSLPPALFTHQAHIRLAWVYIEKYGEHIAAQKCCRQIKRFDEIHGKGSKFNKTVTVAAVKVVHHFMEKSDYGSFKEFILGHPRLKNNFRELLDCHYGFDIFSSSTARDTYLEPDLLPF